MDKFFTSLELPAFKKQISHESDIMLFGSCFTENIGNYLSRYKFKTDINPFGIVYNPRSLANSIRFLLDGKKMDGQMLEFFNGVYFSFLHHGEFSGTDKNECLHKMNLRIEEATRSLLQCNTLIITFGTAWYYRLAKNGMVVSNCHKMPANEFTRHMLTPEEIVKDYKALLNQLYHHDPNLQVIFTISPVRHLKDGAFQNRLSKSSLFVAIGQLLELFPGADYFPAYEIMMDELRDYRFYEMDNVHPNNLAVEHIREKFASAAFGNETKAIIKQIDAFAKAMDHRPVNPETKQHQTFLRTTREKLMGFVKGYPGIDMSKELTYFNQ